MAPSIFVNSMTFKSIRASRNALCWTPFLRRVLRNRFLSVWVFIRPSVWYSCQELSSSLFLFLHEVRYFEYLKPNIFDFCEKHIFVQFQVKRAQQ